MIHLRLAALAVLAAALLMPPLCAVAQPAATPATAGAAGTPGAADLPPPVTLEQILERLPPGPALQQIPQGAAPPAIITGVLSIPQVIQNSVASQEANKVLNARRQKLNEDEQKEQQTLRDLGQTLANEKPKLNAEQARVRERDLQDRFNESRRKFALRDRILQDAGQFCLVQIQRVLTGVVRQVAAAHNMDFVIKREDIVLNTADVDISPQVTAELNKLLPTVIIPPDGVAVTDMKIVTPAAAAAASAPATAASAAPAKPAAPAPQKH